MLQQNVYKILALFGGVLLLFLVGLIFAEVLFRYAVNSPLRGTQDIAKIAVGALVMSGFGYCAWTGGHVSVDLIDSVGSPRFHKILKFIRHAIVAVVMSLLGYTAVLKTLASFRSGEATNLIGVPYWPVYALISLGSIATVLTFLTQLRSSPPQASPPQDGADT